MKTSIHVQFTLYVLLVTAAFAGLILSWFTTCGPLLIILPVAAAVLGRDRASRSGFQRPVNARALFFGFLAFMAIFWASSLLIAHLISPEHYSGRLAWMALGVIWLLCLYPGYRWWRVRKRAVMPNKSPEPTAVGAGSSAVAVHVASRRWLSFHRWVPVAHDESSR
jgi:hypothetical protein